MEVLQNTGNRLRAALDEYLSVCSKMEDRFCNHGMPRNIPQQYSHHISTEIAHFATYSPKLRQAEVAICRIHNHSSRLTPVASLPPEVMNSIFHLVTQPCDHPVLKHSRSYSKQSTSSSEDSGADVEKHHRDLKLHNLPTHLDRLTRVCSHWRRIAIAAPSLWTHIDLIPHKTLQKWFLARAETYAARSTGLPIELHVSDTMPLAYDSTSLCNFLSSIHNRIWSLDFNVSHTWRRFHQSVSVNLFPSDMSQPMALTKIKTSFPMANDEVDEFVGWFDKTNGKFFHITVLHLHGLFPRWGSTFYHNLADLRLVAPRDERWTDIPELSLRKILASSPGLRILHFALHITNRQGDDVPVTMVALNNLEVLNINTCRNEEVVLLRPEYVLRLIAPGSRPLRLSIRHSYLESSYDNENVFYPAEFANFFQRSNVAKFCAEYTCPRLPLHASTLAELVLNSCISGHPARARISLRRGSPATSRLKSLTLFRCSPSLDQLEILLQQHPTDLLFLRNCEYHYIPDFNGSRDLEGRVLQLSEGYPGTKLIMDSSDCNPAANWDLI